MVSVIVPIYNVEKYLKECLYSIIRQSYRDIEIICVNDCTQDNSVYIVREFQKMDSRIRMVSHTENRGLGGARSTGIEAARGQYILFVDADDGIAEDMIERLVTQIEKEKADVAVCGVVSFYPDGTQIKESTFHYRTYVPTHVQCFSKPNDYYHLVNMWPSAANKLFKMEIIKKYNCRFPERILYEDHLFFYQYFSHVKREVYLHEYLYYYRHGRPGSITSFATGREEEVFRVIAQIDEQMRSFMDETTYRRAISRIAYRLLMERQYLLISNRSVWMQYTKKAYDFLEKRYGVETIKEHIDTFYIDDDFYLYMFDPNKRRKDNFKERIKKIPLLVRIIHRIKGKKEDYAAPEVPIVTYQRNPIIENRAWCSMSMNEHRIVEYYAQKENGYQLKDLRNWLTALESSQFQKEKMGDAKGFDTGLELWKRVQEWTASTGSIISFSNGDKIIDRFLAEIYSERTIRHIDFKPDNSTLDRNDLNVQDACKEISSANRLTERIAVVYMQMKKAFDCAKALETISQGIDDRTIFVLENSFNVEGWKEGPLSAIDSFAHQTHREVCYLGYVDKIGQISVSLKRANSKSEEFNTLEQCS